MDDLTEKDGQTIAKLMPLGGPPIIDSLTLTCSSEQAIIFTGAKGYPLFAVVARCHEVQRMSDNDESFLVKGELLDAVELP